MTEENNKTLWLQTKILLAKVIIKNWNKATESEKKQVEKWWKQTYGEFKKNLNNAN